MCYVYGNVEERRGNGVVCARRMGDDGLLEKRGKREK